MNPQKAVILINTGSPDSPKVKDVRKYLRQFLGDKRVINLPWFMRKVLVNWIIAPVRGPKSAKLYERIWTDEGSPLLVNSYRFTKSLQERLGQDYSVFLAMRYGKPSLESVIVQLLERQFSEIIVVPLYPQYADSTTGTIIAEFKRLAGKYGLASKTRIIEPFFEKEGFIESFASKIKSARPHEYDHIIFSFHGLPVKQTEKMHQGYTCSEAGCMHEYNERNKLCYYASCYETVRLLIGSASLNKDMYTVAFQSRLGMNWLKPYTEDVLKEKALRGAKKVLILSPSFVADCLETIHELGIEYADLFKQSGGQELKLVTSLNDDPVWVEAMANIIREQHN